MKNKIIIIIVIICTIMAVYIKFKDFEENKGDINETNQVIEDEDLNVSEYNVVESENNMSVIKITSQNFEKEVINYEKTVLIDFWAEWCKPCTILSPIIEEIAKENQNLKVCKINIDDEVNLASKYGVTAIPTVLIMKNGEIIDTLVGVKSKKEILEATNK